jgi:hypothetical protein
MRLNYDSDSKLGAQLVEEHRQGLGILLVVWIAASELVERTDKEYLDAGPL